MTMQRGPSGPTLGGRGRSSAPPTITAAELMARLRNQQAMRTAAAVLQGQEPSPTPFDALNNGEPYLAQGIPVPQRPPPTPTGWERLMGAGKAATETAAAAATSVGMELPGVRNSPYAKQFHAALAAERAKQGVSQWDVTNPLASARALRSAYQQTDLPSGQMPLPFGKHQQVGVKGALELTLDPVNLIPSSLITKPIKAAAGPVVKPIAKALEPVVAPIRPIVKPIASAVTLQPVRQFIKEAAAKRVESVLASDTGRGYSVGAAEATSPALGGVGAIVKKYGAWLRKDAAGQTVEDSPLIPRNALLANISPEAVRRSGRLALGILASDVPVVKQVLGLINPSVELTKDGLGRAIYVYNMRAGMRSASVIKAILPIRNAIVKNAEGNTLGKIFGLSREAGGQQVAGKVIVPPDALERLKKAFPEKQAVDLGPVVDKLASMPMLMEYGLLLDTHKIITLTDGQRSVLKTLRDVRRDGQQLAFRSGLGLADARGVDWLNDAYMPRYLTRLPNGKIPPPPSVGAGATKEFRLERTRHTNDFDGLARLLHDKETLMEEHPEAVMQRWLSEVFGDIEDNDLLHSVLPYSLRKSGEASGMMAEKITATRMLLKDAEASAKRHDKLIEILGTLGIGTKLSGIRALSRNAGGAEKNLFDLANDLDEKAAKERKQQLNEVVTSAKDTEDAVGILRAEFQRISTGAPAGPLHIARLKELANKLPELWHGGRLVTPKPTGVGAGYSDVTTDTLPLRRLLNDLAAYSEAERDAGAKIARDTERARVEAAARAEQGVMIEAGTTPADIAARQTEKADEIAVALFEMESVAARKGVAEAADAVSAARGVAEKAEKGLSGAKAKYNKADAARSAEIQSVSVGEKKQEILMEVVGAEASLKAAREKLSAAEAAVDVAERKARQAEMVAEAARVPLKGGSLRDTLIADIRRAGQENPLNPREVVLNDVKLEVTPSISSPNRIRVNSIESMSRGKGNASTVLDDLVARADAAGVELELSPQPFGQGGLNQKALEALYARRGFVKSRGEMVRLPVAQSTKRVASAAGSAPVANTVISAQSGLNAIEKMARSRFSPEEIADAWVEIYSEAGHVWEGLIGGPTAAGANILHKKLEWLEDKGLAIGATRAALDEFEEVVRSDFFGDRRGFLAARKSKWDEVIATLRKTKPLTNDRAYALTPEVEKARRALEKANDDAQKRLDDLLKTREDAAGAAEAAREKVEAVETAGGDLADDWSARYESEHQTGPKSQTINKLRGELAKLSDEGFDTGDVESTIDDFEGLQRSDYDSGVDGTDEYRSEKSQAWESVLDTLRGVEPPDVDEAVAGAVSDIDIEIAALREALKAPLARARSLASFQRAAQQVAPELPLPTTALHGMEQKAVTPAAAKGAKSREGKIADAKNAVITAEKNLADAKAVADTPVQATPFGASAAGVASAKKIAGAQKAYDDAAGALSAAEATSKGAAGTLAGLGAGAPPINRAPISGRPLVDEAVVRQEVGRWKPFQIEWADHISKLRQSITNARAQAVFPVSELDVATKKMLSAIDKMSDRLANFEYVSEKEAREFFLRIAEGEYTPRQALLPAEKVEYAELRRIISEEMTAFWKHIKQTKPDWAQIEQLKIVREIAQKNKQVLMDEARIRMDTFGDVSKQANDIARQVKQTRPVQKETLDALAHYMPDVVRPIRAYLADTPGVTLRRGLDGIEAQARAAMADAKSRAESLAKALSASEAEARTLSVGEAFVKRATGEQAGGLSDHVFTERMAERLKNSLGLKDQNWVEETLGHFGKLSDAIRLAKTGIDFGAPLLQGLPYLFQNPAKWGMATGRHYKYWWEAISTGQSPSHAKFMVEHTNTISEMVSKGFVRLFEAENEVFAALQRGEPLQNLMDKKGWPAAVARRTTGSFSTAYSAFNTELQVMWWETNRARALKWAAAKGIDSDIALRDLGDMTNNITGNLSLGSLGLGRTQKIAENTMLFFSPRYTRASLAVVSDVLSGDLRGQMARDAMTRMLVFGVASYYVIARAKGEEPHLDPTKSDFLTIEVMGQPVGPGVFWRSFAKLTAQIINTGAENPADLLNVTDVEANPLVRWARGRMAPAGGLTWDIARGADFVGYPLNNPADWTLRVGKEFLPLWLEGQLLADPFRQNVAGLSQITGLGAPSVPASTRLREERDIAASKMFGGKSYSELNALQRKSISRNADVAEVEKVVMEFRSKTGSATQKWADEMFADVNAANEAWAVVVKEGETNFAKGRIDLEKFRKSFMSVASANRASRMRELNNKDLYPHYAAAREEMRARAESNPDGAQLEDIGYDEYMSIVQDPQWERVWGYDYDGRIAALQAWREKWGPSEAAYVVARQKESRYGSPLTNEYYAGISKFRYYWDSSLSATVSTRDNPVVIRDLIARYKESTELVQGAMRKAYPSLNSVLNTADVVKRKLREQSPELDAFLFRWGYTSTLANPANRGLEAHWRTAASSAVDAQGETHWRVPSD